MCPRDGDGQEGGGDRGQHEQGYMEGRRGREEDDFTEDMWVRQYLSPTSITTPPAGGRVGI